MSRDEVKESNKITMNNMKELTKRVPTKRELTKKELTKVDVKDKVNLSVIEAAALTGVGRNKIYKLLKRPDCDFALVVGPRKTLVKRREFVRFLERCHEL